MCQHLCSCGDQEDQTEVWPSALEFEIQNKNNLQLLKLQSSTRCLADHHWQLAEWWFVLCFMRSVIVKSPVKSIQLGGLLLFMYKVPILLFSLIQVICIKSSENMHEFSTNKVNTLLIPAGLSQLVTCFPVIVNISLCFSQDRHCQGSATNWIPKMMWVILWEDNGCSIKYNTRSFMNKNGPQAPRLVLSI